jgi:ectoine hydroxylase-related dioxygenase (phytanoyl-CoA dioxygenase family)
MEKDEASYRFPFEDEKGWRKHLHDEGFVVIANYLSQEECHQYVEEFWDIMEVLADGTLDKKDPATHSLGKNYPPVLHGGMIQYIGHSQPQWALRKKAVPLFEKLWKTKDLKSSFDGFCFMNGARNYQKRAINSFLHCDQAPVHLDVWSYQGVQTLTDSGEDEGGFVCVPKSNLYHQQYFKEKGMEKVKQNWYLIPEEDKEKEPMTNVFKVDTKAGDFILFDSRTFHCNTVPTKNVLRVCTYICMLPANHVPEKIRGLRELAAKNRRVSCHHPGDGFRTFPAQPRFLSNPARFGELQNKVNDCEFDEQIKALI